MSYSSEIMLTVMVYEKGTDKPITNATALALVATYPLKWLPFSVKPLVLEWVPCPEGANEKKWSVYQIKIEAAPRDMVAFVVRAPGYAQAVSLPGRCAWGHTWKCEMEPAREFIGPENTTATVDVIYHDAYAEDSQAMWRYDNK